MSWPTVFMNDVTDPVFSAPYASDASAARSVNELTVVPSRIATSHKSQTALGPVDSSWNEPTVIASDTIAIVVLLLSRFRRASEMRPRIGTHKPRPRIEY